MKVGGVEVRVPRYIENNIIEIQGEEIMQIEKGTGSLMHTAMLMDAVQEYLAGWNKMIVELNEMNLK